METVALLYEDYQKELAEDFKNTFLKRASDTDSSRSNDTVIDEVTDMLSTNIAVYTEKLLQRWGFSSGGEGGGGGDVTVTLDDLLKKYLSDNYVTIKGDQEVFGEKDFRKGIRIAGRRLYWDEGNDALVIEGAAYTTRWLSAKGVSPGGGGAGSGGAAAMYQLIDVSPNDTKDAVLGAEKDYVLTFDGSFWRGMPNKGGLSSKLFTALDKEGNEVNPDDENAEIYAIRANYSLWSVGFLSAKGISDGGTGGGGGGAVALYQLLDVEKNADITGVAGATKGSVLTFNGDKWYADKPKTAAGISNLFTALDNDGNEVDLNDESKLGTITNIRANYALWSVDWISAKGKSSGGSGGGGGLINLVYGFESLGGTFDNNDNSATFNAFTINEIWKLASSGLTNVTVTGSGNAVTDVIKGSDGRSLTFTKGSTFATKSEFDALNTKFNDFLTGSDADDIINKWSELEVFLQGMKESDNLAVILQSKMDKTAFSKLFTALDKEGNEVNPDDENAEIYAIRANYSLWSVGFLSAKGISDGGTGGGGGGAVALYQLLDVEKNADITGVAGATKGSVLTFNGDKWYADKPKTAAGISNLFTALDNDGNEVDLNDESKLGTITNIRANYALWSVDWISAKGKSSGGSGGGGGLINLVYGFESLGGTFDNNDNSATFNAFTINEIWKLASSGLTNVTVTGSGNAVTDVIKGSDGRSLTFTKGSTFATKSEFDALNTKFNDFLTGSDADDIINKWSELEVFLQGMKESDNLAVILQSKMDKTAFSKLFTALDASGNEVDPSDDTKTIASIRANFGFWGVDYISAKGVSKGSGGTGGASTLYQLVDVLANDTEDGVEGAAAGKALVFDGTHWRAGDAGLNESQLYSYLTANKYLTQSAADSRYVTSSRKVIAGTGLSGGGALTSDVTLSLGTSGVVAGTYTKVMVDAYGRVTSGTNLSATDIPNLDWSKITTGKPTTLAGYGITDAVTLTTAQTISGQKTFTKNILMNSGIGLSYGGNTVFRNTTGNTVISSYGNKGMIYFRPNGDTSDVGVIQINKQGHLNGVSAGFTGGVSAARLTANEYIQIGDAYLKWDAANNAVYVIKKDGTTPVGFYSTDWLSAKGISDGGTQTGTLDSLNDVEITDPTNGQALKYDAASKKWVNGTIDSFNVNQMWAELKKADSSKVIDASHIPTSVLDGRWVKKTGDTMTGTLTSASTNNAIIFKGLENCDITNFYTMNGTLDSNSRLAIRNGLRFNWYDTYWYIGNIRGESTDSNGFGIANEFHKLCLQVTPNNTIAPVFRSTVATGVSPLIVSSNTLVNNLNADLLDGYHQSSFLRADGVNQYVTLSSGDGNNEGYRLVFEGTVTGGWSINSMTLLVNSKHAGTGMISIVFHTTNQESTSYIGSLNYYGSTISLGDTMWRLFYNTTTKKVRLFWRFYDYSDCQVSILNRRGIITNISNKTWYTTIPSDSGSELPAYYNWASSAHALATSRTLWGQPFNGTANVSGDMTGVGNITMSGDLKIGNGTSPNAILFYGTTGDALGGYNHTFIAERFWGGTERGELVLFKGNDLGNDNEAVNVSNSGPDRIRHIAAAHLFQTYTSPLAGSVEDVCTSSALKNLFGIAANRVTSYVPFMSTVASGTAPFIVVSNTVVGNLNADLLDGVHLAGFGGREGVMRSWTRGIYTTVNQYFGNGNVVTIDPKPTDDATLSANTTVLSLGDTAVRNTQLAFHYNSNTIKYRRHDDSRWNDWVVLIHSGNYASYSDGRYVKKSGDTMTGDLAMDTNKGFYFPHGTRVVKTSGNWIHDGADVASSTDANLRFGSWQGIGWYPTISGQTVAQGKNAMWLNVRTGVLDVHSNITSHNGYLAANWDSARRLVLGGGSYSWIGSRDSSNNVLCNIVLYDNKVYIGNYVESRRFVSTVGTGTQPYQCNSTTLNTNLNADMLDNWHLNFLPRNYNIGRCYAVRFALGGEDNGWKKIFACSESGAGPYKSVTVWGQIWYAYGNHANNEVRNYHFCAIFQMRSGPSASDSNVGILINSARLYLPTFAKGMDNIRLVRVGTNNFELQVRQIGSYHNANIEYQYWSYGCNVSAWESLQSTSNTTVAVSAGGASTLADSRASSADVWTSARTFYIQDHNASHTGAGVSVNGSANVYLKLPNSIQCSDWFRSTGNSGWYHQNYGGGIYMEDSNFIRNFGGKRLLIQTDTYETLRLVRTSGSGGSSIAFYNGGGTFRGQLGVNASSWFSFDTGTSTAKQNVVEISPAGGIHSKAEITAKASGSDIRLKKDIQNYNAMNIINRFRSVKYHWNDIAKANSEVYNNDYDQFGLIAQDLIAGGFEQWVRDVFHDYYTVTYERLIPVVWKGLQEVDDEVTKLKKEVARLNKRVKELEKSLCA